MQQNIALLTLTRKATAAIAARRFVTVAGAQAAADANAFGVSRTDAVIGALFPIDVEGTAVVETGGAIADGDTIKVDASGRGITWGISGAKVAQALEAAGGPGEFIEVRLIPNVA